MNACRFTVLAMVVVAHIGLQPAQAQNKIYLAEYKFNDPKLYRMDVDGGNVEELSVFPRADWLPLGLQLDTAAGKIYWTHGSFNQGAIR
ncbi:MAG: hypothetical protein IH988_12075, partial [Planctomycetes bacterium]|nr:hypothetical protein [Planctomycetota bacterium]